MDNRPFENIAHSGFGYVETTMALPEKPTVESDLKILEDVDFNKLEIPRGLFSKYGEAVLAGEKVETPEQALLDLAWRIRLGDGNEEGGLEILRKFTDEKGVRSGFVMAMIFLNDCQALDMSESPELPQDKVNVVSNELKKFMMDKIGNYLTSIDHIDGNNNDQITNDLFFVGNIINSSVADITDERYVTGKDFAEMKAFGKPTSFYTYLNIDDLVRLINTVETTGKDLFESENVYLSTLVLKKKLSGNGLVFDH